MAEHEHKQFIRGFGTKGERDKKRATYDGGGLVLVELLLKERDAERHAEKVDRVASPGKPSTQEANTHLDF